MRRLALLLLLAVLLAPHAYAEDPTGAQADAMAAAPATSAQGVTIRGRNPYVFTEVLVGGDLAPGRLTQDIRNLTGRQRMELRPIGGRIRKVVLNDVAFPQAIDLGLEELGTAIDVEGRPSVDAVAIDPTRITFGSGTFTKQAVGNKVWKCALWNFTAARCDGDWETILVVTPGQEYEVAFNATDPAYVETFNENESLDVSLAALDNTTLVIAYIDTSFNASFEIWSTNGVELVSRVNIDTSGDSGSRIEVDAINATHFVIGVLDGPLDDFNFYIYDRTGAQSVGLTQIDPNMGTVGDVGVCEMGDRFGAVWADQNDGDANYEVWRNAGTSIFVESQVDISIGPAAAGQNLVSCAAMNSTHVGYAFFDDVDNDATLAVFRETGTIQVTEVDIDNNVGETGQVAVAGLRDGKVAMAFYDSTDQDITITVRNATAGALTTVLANTDIDTAAGTTSRVSVAEIENNGASDFVVAWQDQAAGDIKAGVYDAQGAQVTAPFTITATQNTTYNLLDVAGYSSNLGIGLCNGTFAIAYTNATLGTVFETYWLNGTRWDGVCGAPDTLAPVINIMYPDNATTNTTSNVIDFTFNITDSSTIANCTLIVDNADSNTLSNPSRDVAINLTAFLDNGDHIWAIRCEDTVGNTNTTSLYNITIDVPLIISGADVRLAALDDTTLVIAYIDTGENDATFEIWDTNGTLLVPKTDADTTVDADSRIDVDVINSTHFVIGVLDGPLDDFNFYIYNRTGSQIQGLTQIDPNAGTNTDVGICQLGNRFGAVWADQTDGDANYEVWSDAGTVIFTESQVDTGITPSATQQNLVSCAALNSTHVGYAFFDDADNDATLAVFRENGAVQVVETDIDINVGETGQVAVAGMRNNRVAMAFYDSTDQDLTITVRDAAGNALNTILAVTDIDLTAGTDSRVSVAEIEHSGASDFVVAWQDQAAGDIKAAVYDNGGTEITAPFTITTAPNASFPLLDVAGYSSNLGIGLCNGTFAIVYTNASGSTVLEKYWLNGSAWNGHCGEPPAVDNATMAASYVLNAGTTKRVECNISTSDPDGGNTIASANATLYFQLNTSLQADNPLEHYSNASCTSTGMSGFVQNFTCGFDVWYLARNGTWYCEGVVVDATGKESFAGGVGNTTIDPLYALNVTNTSMDFGRVGGGFVSSNISQNISNVGNQRINVTALAYGRDPGDGISFACATHNISVDALRFAPNITAGYAAKEVMSSSFKQLRLSVPSPVAVGSPRMNTSYWQVLVPPLNASDFGLCNGTIVFQAEFG